VVLRMLNTTTEVPYNSLQINHETGFQKCSD
jgi:hypothetical protein